MKKRMVLAFVGLLITQIPVRAEAPKFVAQTLDPDIQIGYGLSLGRVDADEHVDLLLADKKEVVWYQNPGAQGKPWEKHVIARNLTPRDNVCLAARDTDGDGLVEVAVGADWNPGETNDANTSGALFYLRRPEDPRKPWTPVRLQPHEPTTHRMHWVRADDKFYLAILPLHGVGNQKAQGATVQISLFDLSEEEPRLVRKVDTEMHMTHNFELLTDAEFGDQEFVLVAGKEGYGVSFGGGESMSIVDSSQSKGAGEVRRYPIAKRAFVGIEPMHGTDVVVYQSDDAGGWGKDVIDTTLAQGHALAAAQLFGSPRPEIVAGWRNPNQDRKVGIRIYEYEDGKWNTHVLDDNKMACEDLKVADLDGDGKLDVVAAGRATKNVVVYWNHSP